ncbi:ATP-binding protein [Desulfobacterales bacterium HSG16]|nr:ATP-binding protein [Desulfobacterales bacterium HSG16]
MGKRTLFNIEEQTIAEAETIVSDPVFQDNPLVSDFERLLNSYRKIYKQTRRLIKMSDMQQQRLNKAIKEVEEAREIAVAASMAKGDFLANMSHEIRTPMNAIIGMTDLALNVELHPKVKSYLSTVKKSAHSLLMLINDILDLAKIEAGKMDLEVAAFKLSDVADSLYAMFSSKTSEKGLELLISIEEDVPQRLIGDSLRLGQVLINLTNNAFKFTEKGHIFLNIELVEFRSERVLLKFMVEDTGIGIPLEILPTLFKSFTQADSSTTRKYGGTGLGLSICNLLAELMGGEIWAESTLQSGTRFYFTAEFGLDLNASNDENTDSAIKTDISEKEMMEQLVGARVLLVEDNSINQQVAVEILGSVGIIVDIADNGQEAVEAIHSSPYDAVLMDVQMPVMDGLEASIEIRKDGRFNDLPIIAMTAHAMKGDREKCIEAGMNDYITKPINTNDLFAILSGWISDEGEGIVLDESCVDQPDPDEWMKETEFSPAMPGIDGHACLKELGGNKNLLLKLLNEFTGRYADSVSEIRNALNKGDLEFVQRLGHTLKGVSGIFSAKQLYAASLKLETIVKDRRSDQYDNIICEFGNALDHAMESARQLEKEFEDTSTINMPDEGTDNVKKDTAQLSSELGPELIELHKYLKEHNPRAEATLESIKPTLMSNGFKEEVLEMEKSVNRFDFKSAVSILKDIATSLEIVIQA